MDLSDPPAGPADSVTCALAELADAVAANQERCRLIKRRITSLQRQLEKGRPLREIVPDEPSPLIVELITANIESLHTAGARLRWAEASALREAGMTVADIARLFGVTRQRVSGMLLQPPVAARDLIEH